MEIEGEFNMFKRLLALMLFILAAVFAGGCDEALPNNPPDETKPSEEALPNNPLNEAKPPKEALRYLIPDNKKPIADYDSIDSSIDLLVSNLEDVPAGEDGELKAAIKALALNNPVYTPEKVIEMFSEGLKGFKEDEYGWGSFTDKYIYLGEEALEITPLRWAFAHELSHGLAYCYKNDVFPCYIEDIQGLDWSGRINEGLTDLYSLSALGGMFSECLSINIKSYWRIEAQVSYPGEQASAVMFCNALGREAVWKAYFGTQEDYDALVDCYERLTGRPYIEFLESATELTAYASVFSDKEPCIEEATHAAKKYFDLILEICEKRDSNSSNPITSSEIEALIALSCEIYDEEYMEYYYETLNGLLANS